MGGIIIYVSDGTMAHITDSSLHGHRTSSGTWDLKWDMGPQVGHGTSSGTGQS